ncbi:hypothetical protein KY284_007987 [Solanum tuberosum]|nr:hypothetical protein KY284_007987 [Solanum tuberosum]
MNRRYNFAFIALLEPFQDPGEIEQYKRRLGFDRVAVNSSAKIWVFWKDHWEGQIGVVGGHIECGRIKHRAVVGGRGF